MSWLRELTISDRVFLVLNLLAVIVGVVLIILSGPSAPLVLLVIGAAGLAIKKLPRSLFGKEKPPA